VLLPVKFLIYRPFAAMGHLFPRTGWQRI